MFELKQQANGGNGGVREVVVGWFCTGSEMTELTCAVHGWFKQFSSVSKFFPQPPLTEPIHLMVDAVMESGSFAVKASIPSNWFSACISLQLPEAVAEALGKRRVMGFCADALLRSRSTRKCR